ncbi:MAG: ATP-binding protein [Pseudacidovorax sp.]|nr:ATP-binding protein [Pseudacidovorax sp.]
MASNFIEGLALANYRGVGGETQFIGPFGKINFFIGANNSGKSTVLHCLSSYFSEQFKAVGKTASIHSIDKNVFNNTAEVIIGVGIDPEKIKNGFLFGFPPHAENERISAERYTDWFIKHITHSGLCWFRPVQGEKLLQAVPPFKFGSSNDLAEVLNHQQVRDLWSAATNRTGGGRDAWVNELDVKIRQAIKIEAPRVRLVPAIRSVGSSEEPYDDLNWSGKGIIDLLARHQNPDWDDRGKRKKFDQINEFLQWVTGNDTALIEIPADRKHILVHMDGKILPLTSLGTGIHEVVMLAAFCTFATNEVICIEEPEIHLHPLLQKRLMKYIAEKTQNQYFIATHSSSLIDSSHAQIFHVTGVDGKTTYSSAVSTRERFDLFHELGYRASDLLQTNSIIWVEGPSDRIYLNFWIKNAAPDLVEGIDYSIMFYGGRLLSHLTTKNIDEQERDVRAMIAVRNLNQNLCMIIDSDRRKKNSSINSTKLRVVEEVEKGRGVAWVTEGREIENYISNSVMADVLKSIYPEKYIGRSIKGKFDRMLSFQAADGNFEQIDKIKVAEQVCQRPVDFGILDLATRISSIAAFIRECSNFQKPTNAI